MALPCRLRSSAATKRPAGVVRSSGRMLDNFRSPMPGTESSPSAEPSSARALLGSALGDDSVPGIGDRKLSSIRPEERTTPAGRFVAALGLNLGGAEILWVDYDGAVSM